MGTHPIFESDFDCLTEMIIDRSKDFESILGNLRRENNELSKNILEKRKISAYRRSMMGVAERISSIRAKVRNISIDQSDGFLSECSKSLKEISDMSFIDMPANKNERKSNRNKNGNELLPNLLSTQNLKVRKLVEYQA